MSEIALPAPYMLSEYRSIPPRPPVALYTADQVRQIISAERERIASKWEEAHGFDKHGVAEFVREGAA